MMTRTPAFVVFQFPLYTAEQAPRGGTFLFEVPATGRYRISITSRHWIDVADGETAIESADHFGPGCEVLHKIVEFDLTSGRKLMLQLSGQDDAIVGLAITASPRAGMFGRSRKNLAARSHKTRRIAISRRTQHRLE